MNPLDRQKNSEQSPKADDYSVIDDFSSEKTVENPLGRRGTPPDFREWRGRKPDPIPEHLRWALDFDQTLPFDNQKPVSATNPVPKGRYGVRRIPRGVEFVPWGWMDPWRNIRHAWYRPGESGNTQGANHPNHRARQPKRRMQNAIYRFLGHKSTNYKFMRDAFKALGVDELDYEQWSVAEGLVFLNLIYNSARGSSSHIKILLDRSEGRVPQPIMLTDATEDQARAVREALAKLAMSEIETQADQLTQDAEKAIEMGVRVLESGQG